MRLASLLIASLLLAACAGGGRNLDAPAPEGAQRIVFWSRALNERIDVTFRDNGHYVPSAFAKIDHLFRDHHNGEEYAIDPGLIEVIANLRDRMVMAPDTPIELLSGYRSPETNGMLASKSKNVAKHSYHMRGMAADIRIPEMNSHALELVAKTLQKGGVAMYPDSGHVHVDTGPIRGWEVVPGFESGLGDPSKPPRIKKSTLLLKKPAFLKKVTVTPAPLPGRATPPSMVRAKPVYSPAKPAKTRPVKKPARKKKKATTVKKHPVTP
ncbi:MAG: DUF882 domain-containing protein [Proteobacteria bacterium]|nr:DUF882 domain-containing protein [Pseudomonadota bacterium]